MSSHGLLLFLIMRPIQYSLCLVRGPKRCIIIAPANPQSATSVKPGTKQKVPASMAQPFTEKSTYQSPWIFAFGKYFLANSLLGVSCVLDGAMMLKTSAPFNFSLSSPLIHARAVATGFLMIVSLANLYPSNRRRRFGIMATTGQLFKNTYTQPHNCLTAASSQFSLCSF